MIPREIDQESPTESCMTQPNRISRITEIQLLFPFDLPTYGHESLVSTQPKLKIETETNNSLNHLST